MITTDRLMMADQVVPDYTLSSPALWTCQYQRPVTGGKSQPSATLDLGAEPAPPAVGHPDADAARVKAAGDVAVFAMTVGGASTNGDWSATSLNQTASWAAGGQGGNFTHSMPITPMPPVPGGLHPDLSSNYSSGTHDGLTARIRPA